MGQIWVVAIQVLTVPLLTLGWGGARYGVWLMISTIPTYVAIGSAGFGTAAAIDMTRNFATGDRDQVLRTFQSVWILISLILAPILVGTGVLWLFREPVLRLLPASFMDEDVFAAACILVVYSVAAIEMYYLNAGYQCSGRYAQGTFLFDLAYPLEAAALVAACLLDGRMIVAALAMTSVRVLALLAYYLRLLHYEPWMKLGWSHASMAVVRRLAHPALASLSMTVSSALSLEGLVLTLGIVVSPTATAIFATTRTVTRVPLSFARLVSRATLPEMTAAFSTGNKRLAANLVALNLAFTTAIAGPAAIVLIALGPFVVDVLSHHKLKSNFLLFAGLSLTAFFQATWATVSQFLIAVNKQQKFAYQYLVISAVVGMSPLLFTSSSTNIRASLVWCLGEALMCAIVYRVWWTETDLSLDDLVEGWRSIVGDGRRLIRQLVGNVGGSE
jgi:O-antigen/teichoic acid export membrane protein